MVEMSKFIICFGMVCLCCMSLGWYVGYNEAKRKYNKKTVLKRFVLPKDAVIEPCDIKIVFREELV